MSMSFPNIDTEVQRIRQEGAARSVWANTLSAPQRS